MAATDCCDGGGWLVFPDADTVDRRDGGGWFVRPDADTVDRRDGGGWFVRVVVASIDGRDGGGALPLPLAGFGTTIGDTRHPEGPPVIVLRRG